MSGEAEDALVIRGRAVRVDETGLTCLNDIWTAAGFTKNQRPGDWTRLGTTIRRIERVLKLITGKSRNYTKTDIQRVLRTRRGADGGTYADVRLALDYAEYLNPALAIEVKEVFLRYKAADPTLADEVMERADAEANEWMAKRSMARAARLGYTDTLKRHGVAKPGEYAECTNATYLSIFGKRAVELRTARGLKKGQPLRDAMDLRELATVAFSEVLSSDRIEEEECRGFSECQTATRKVSSAVRDLIDRDKKDRQKRLFGS
jgi:hypothetical protein